MKLSSREDFGDPLNEWALLNFYQILDKK